MKNFTIIFLSLIFLFACQSNTSKTDENAETVVEEVESAPEVTTKALSLPDNFALKVDTQNAEYVLALFLPAYGDSCNTNFDTIIPRDKAIQLEMTNNGIRYRITDKEENGVKIASPYEENAGVKLFTDSEDNPIILGETNIRDASIDGDGVLFKVNDTNYIQIDVDGNNYDEIVIISPRDVSHYDDGLTPHCD